MKSTLKNLWKEKRNEIIYATLEWPHILKHDMKGINHNENNDKFNYIEIIKFSSKDSLRWWGKKCHKLRKDIL